MTVTSCCGCCSVKTGAIIIGLLSAIGNGILAVYLIVNKSQGLNVSYLLISLIQMVVAIIFLSGVAKRKIQMVFPFICVSFINVLTYIPMFTVTYIQLAVLMQASAGTYVGIIFGSIIGFALSIYFFIVVNTFYKELLEEKYERLFTHGNSVNVSNKRSHQAV